MTGLIPRKGRDFCTVCELDTSPSLKLIEYWRLFHWR